MGDESGMTPIAKARGEPVNKPDGPIRRAEKKSPGIRGHTPTVELRDEFAPALPNAIPVALQCVGIGECPPSRLNSFSQNKLYPFRDPDAPQSVRDAG